MWVLSDSEFGIVYLFNFAITLYFLISNIGVHNLRGESIPKGGFEKVSVGNLSFSFTQNYILRVLFKEWTVICWVLLLQGQIRLDY